ncbi:MAG TPA: hypothetical protein VFJ06_06880 [Halococcus sp.]|nr:hypothetical protein [Halococcus sp.]
MADNFRPFIDRHREPKQRVYTELTQTARERIAHLTKSYTGGIVKSALEATIEGAGKPNISESLNISGNWILDDGKQKHTSIVEKADTEYVLTYIEYLFYSHSRIEEDELETVADSITNVFETESILLQTDNTDETIVFEPIESESMSEIDEQIQALGATDEWREPLRGYNAAFRRYSDGDFDELIPKKLYNSIEAVLQTICVDHENWTDNRDMNHSKYLLMLKDHDVYNANGITEPELNDLLTVQEKLTAKLGNDRKQRHNYIDRTYCTLLIHQTGAYLYFLINRYEQYRSDKSN